MKKILAIAIASLACSSAVAADGNADRAKVNMCQGCHGIPYYQASYPHVYRVPKIAGQTKAYITKALEAYRSGERDHPAMRGIAIPLSEQEIADLAAYYGLDK